MSLTDVYNTLSARDQELEKEAAIELEKQAEEDAAGRIMARGFYDELQKLAESANFGDSSKQVGSKGPGKTIKSKGYDTGGGATGPSFGGTSRRQHKAPKAPKLKPGKFGGGNKVKGTTGQITDKK